MTKYVVVLDAYLVGDDKGNQQRYFRGDEIDLTGDDAQHALDLGAVAKPDDAADALSGGDRELTDDEIRNLSAADATAYVGQHPEQAGRVYTVEASGKNRQTVIAATGVEPPGD